VHRAQRVESKVALRFNLRPVRFAERGENPLHSFWRFEIRHARSAVKDFEGGVVPAMGF
jgi:hypothetical protein